MVSIPLHQLIHAVSVGNVVQWKYQQPFSFRKCCTNMFVNILCFTIYWRDNLFRMTSLEILIMPQFNRAVQLWFQKRRKYKDNNEFVLRIMPMQDIQRSYPTVFFDVFNRTDSIAMKTSSWIITIPKGDSLDHVRHQQFCFFNSGGSIKFLLTLYQCAHQSPHIYLVICSHSFVLFVLSIIVSL